MLARPPGAGGGESGALVDILVGVDRSGQEASLKTVDRLDRFQRRHAVVGLPLAVVYKFFDDRGTQLAALLTYYGFLSIFPLFLLFTSLLGFLLHGDPDLQQRVVDSALASVPLLRSQLRDHVGQFSGSGFAVVVGIVGPLLGGLGVVQSAQTALNRIHAVPRFAQPNPLKSRLRSLALILVLGLTALVSTAVSSLVLALGEHVPTLRGLVPVAAVLAGIAVNLGIFLVVYRVLPATHLGWRDVWVGSLVAAVLWQLLQTFGTYLLGRQLSRDADAYGVFGVVLGLLVWIYLLALVFVLAVEIDVVRRKRLYPRALLTPFTDDVDLTGADVRTYTAYATSERYKGYEKVEATFDRDDRSRHTEAPS